MSYRDDAVRGTDRIGTYFPMIRWSRIAVVLLLIVGLVACGQPGEETQTEGGQEPGAETSPAARDELETSPVPEAGGQAEQAFLDDITANSAYYYGRTVRVDGIVEEVAGESGAFTIVRTEGDPNEVPVVLANETASGAVPAQGEAVQVVGTVHELAIDELEQELGVELDANFLEEYAANAVIVATSIQPSAAETAASASPEAEMEASPSPDADAEAGFEVEGSASPEAGASPAPAIEVTLEELLGNFAQYDRQMVMVEGEVAEVISPSAFSIVEEAGSAESITSGLLIVMREEDVDITEGDRVRVTGRADEFDTTTVEAELGYHLDETQPYAPWIGQPVVIAHELEPIQ